MQERATPALRWSRALVLAGVAFGLGVVGHLSAGGLVPGPTGLLLLFGAAVVLSATLLGRPAGTLRVTAMVVAGQAAIHTVLTAAAGHAGDPAHGVASPVTIAPLPVTAVDRSGSLHDVYSRGARAGGHTDAAVVPDWAQHLLADLTGPHAAMALVHLLAALLVGLWLASGERALWAVLRLTRDALATTLRTLGAALAAVPAPPAAPAGPRLDGRPRPRLRSALLADSVRRRGPPALLAA